MLYLCLIKTSSKKILFEVSKVYFQLIHIQSLSFKVYNSEKPKLPMIDIDHRLINEIVFHNH